MKLSCEKSQILHALATVAGVISKKSTLPILGCFYLSGNGHELFVTGTDLETELTMRCDVDQHEPFIVCLPRRLLDIVRAFPDDKTIVMLRDENKVLIKCGRSRFTIQSLSGDVYPNLNTQDFPINITIDQVDLKDILRRVGYAMAKDDARYYLNGMMIEVSPTGLAFVATNGHRLGVLSHLIELPIIETKQFILPYNAIIELQRILSQGSCLLAFNQNHCLVKTDHLTFVGKLIDGRYPDFRRMIKDDYPIIVQTERELLSQAIKRTALVLGKGEAGIKFEFNESGLKLTAKYDDHEAYEDVDTEHQGDPVVIGFNAIYVKDVLDNMTSKNVRIGLIDERSMISITSCEADEGHHTIMSMRL